jgi:hypothetical protein
MLLEAVAADTIGEKMRGFEATNNAWPMPNVEQLLTHRNSMKENSKE